MAYVITNVSILDGTGREPFRGAVRVEANRIAEVTAGSAAPDAAGATVIDGRGATLMPGLIESHAHLGLADITRTTSTGCRPRSTCSSRCAMRGRCSTAATRARSRRRRPSPGWTSSCAARSTRGASRAPAPRQRPGDHGDGRARRHQPAAPAALRDADLRVGRGRARRDPPRVPPPRARGRRPAEAQPLGRPRDVELSIRADPDDRRRGGGGDGGGAGGELARRARTAGAPSPS